ncbi:hypothetical protein LAZ67_23001453 [Cordylochernes scorpioides]|uniref:Uncharacterized protein n=1 Tax=Cordylochernes scorpioides TaxID=51811 RepID=A0ABY6LR40_9ARAC|nr:hypothetical protein LAZ67_23001453 [Cordylochernes scorpioides]
METHVGEVILVKLLRNRIDEDIERQWELVLDEKSFPFYESFILFLEKQARSLSRGSKDIEERKMKFKGTLQTYTLRLIPMLKGSVTINQVLLATARIIVEGANGTQQICRALLDSGSQLYGSNNNRIRWSGEKFLGYGVSAVITRPESKGRRLRNLLHENLLQRLPRKIQCETTFQKTALSARTVEKALARFLTLERRLLKTPRVYEQYK